MTYRQRQTDRPRQTEIQTDIDILKYRQTGRDIKAETDRKRQTGRDR